MTEPTSCSLLRTVSGLFELVIDRRMPCGITLLSVCLHGFTMFLLELFCVLSLLNGELFDNFPFSPPLLVAEH